MQPEKVKELGIEDGFTNPREYMELFAARLFFNATYKIMANELGDKEMEEGELVDKVVSEIEFLWPEMKVDWKEQVNQMYVSAYMAGLIDVYHEDFDKPSGNKFGCYTTVKLNRNK